MYFDQKSQKNNVIRQGIILKFINFLKNHEKLHHEKFFLEEFCIFVKKCKQFLQNAKIFIIFFAHLSSIIMPCIC